MEYETVIELTEGIIPDRLYWRQRSFTIVWTHHMYIIRNYLVVHSSSKLQTLFILNAWHPNAGILNAGTIPIDMPPSKQEFCLPEWVVGIEMDECIYQNLERYILNRWWLDDPHHYPMYGKHFTSDPSIEIDYRR
jgi:hypothetical protein